MPSPVETPRVFRTVTQARDFCKNGAVVTIGNFDGVHIGHQELVKRTLLEAKRGGWRSVVLTFAPHPVKVLAPAAAPKLIHTEAQKFEALAALGVDAIVAQKFDSGFANKTAETFFNDTLVHDLAARHIVVGYDFTFGKARTGTIETLEILAYRAGIGVTVMPAKMKGKTLASSTLVRRLISDGNIALANRLLNREFFIDGTVVHGHKRGAALGVHTANVAPDNELIPADGVYATLIRVGNKTLKSVTNIGLNPTFSNDTRSIEAHIFNFDDDIYAQPVRLAFIKRLRDEKKFATPEDLVKQIKKDIASAKVALR